jgi:hypothetical protein
MTQNFSARLAAAVLVGAVALQLAGCSQKATIKPDATVKFLTDHLSKQTGFTPTDMSCPSGVEAKVGAEFECHFTGPDGPNSAHLKITKINGDDVSYDWHTDRPYLKPDTTAKFLTDQLSSQTGFTPTDVSCPSGVEAKVGAEFECHFTGPEGPYTAHLKITKINGDDVFYDWRAYRS